MSLWKRVLTERRGLVVPILAALVINLLIAGAAVMPLSRSVESDEVRAGDMKFALADAQRTARVASDTRTSQVQAGAELQKFYADVLPQNLGDARSALFLELIRISEETGLQYQNNVFEPEEVDDSPLMRYRTDVVLNGEYAGIRRFLYLLETAQQFFVVESVKFGQSGQNQGRGGSIEVVLQVTTYYNNAAPAGAGQ